MNKILKYVVGLTAVLALTSCSKEVDEAEFKKQAEAIEEPAAPYATATLTWSYHVEESGLTEEDVNESKSGKTVFTYTTDGWTASETPDEYNEDLFDIVGANLKDLLASGYDFSGEGAEELPEGVTATSSVKYYVNPFSVKGSVSLDMSSEGQTMKIEGSTSMEFDQYGFITKADIKSNTQMSISYMGVTIEGKSVIDMSASIIYK